MPQMEKEVDGDWMPTLTPIIPSWELMRVLGNLGCSQRGKLRGGGVTFWELFWPEIKGFREVEN